MSIQDGPELVPALPHSIKASPILPFKEDANVNVRDPMKRAPRFIAQPRVVAQATPHFAALCR